MAKKSKFGRMMKLGGLSSRISSSYLGQKITGAFQNKDSRSRSLEKLHLKNAERLVGTLGKLKGAAMKVGQSISVILDTMEVPQEISGILRQLNDSAEPVPFDEILSVLTEEFGKDPYSIFEHIDPVPLGTASLAQAHSARLPGGEAVVLKVLHDGVEDSVDTDLSALKSILLAGRMINRSKEEIDIVFAEIRERLLEELDYHLEAKNLDNFHKAFSSIPGLNAPKPIFEFCTDRVIVMERMIGAPLETFLSNASEEAKQKAGDILTTAFYEMLYRFRSLHADPHGGNFLFANDGSVSFIDFGCVKSFDMSFVKDYGRLSCTTIDRDREGMLLVTKKMGLLSSDNPAAEEAIWQFADILGVPFRTELYHAGGDDDVLMSEVRKQARVLLSFKEIRATKDVIYLHRSLTGIYAMLRRLGHRADYNSDLRKYVKHATDVADLKIPDQGLTNG